MKKFFAFAMAALVLTSCDKEEATADSSFAMKATAADYSSACTLPVTTVTGEITANTTWDNDHVWVISGIVRVKSGATLTIEAGTYIKADLSHAAPTGVLVITKTGKINAIGTAANPIVFTSAALLDCDAATTPKPGDFGGVVFLGDAPVNTGSVTNVIEGLGDQSPAADFQYGGTNSTHDVGSFQYVRIEYAGRKLTENVEINGLTLGGVGDAGLSAASTKIHHVQVTYGLDDAFEFFGGNADARYLVAFGQDDDAFDFDLGYTGTVNYAVALADKNSTHSLSGTNPDSNGIELDNDATGSTNTPFTRPIVNHLSIIGVSSSTDAARYENGIHVRRNGRITLQNSTVAGYGVNANTTTTPATPDSWAIRFESPSLNTDSGFSNVQVNAFRTSPFTTPGSISANVTEVSSNNFGMTQPFFNNGTINFAGATNGAFVDGATWIDNWTKFSNF